MHWSTRCLPWPPRILPTCFCWVLALALVPVTAQAQIEVSNCYVTLLEDVELPAEVAGVILALDAKEGQEVKTDDQFGSIDDREARANYKLTKIELEAAKDEAGNDVRIRYARAQEAVAKAEMQAAKDTNRRRPGVIAPAEMRTLELSVTQASLGIEQAQMDKHLLKYSVDANQAKLELAKDEVLRRQIRSPLDGVIVEIRRRKGEWVNPGDTVLQIVRMDQLRVEGFVNINKYSRDQVAGRSVVAKVDLGGGRMSSFNGKITFVSPLIRAGGDYRVRAEVENREQNGNWLLQPGQKATLNIGGRAEAPAPDVVGSDGESR